MNQSILFQPLASEEGYTPDAYVTSDEVVSARPSPSMIYLNMIRSEFQQGIEDFKNFKANLAYNL